MIRFVALSGFLGAGKTTTLIAAARTLQAQGHRVAVVTNDQGTELVDTTLARSSIDDVAEVIGGCFCCRFEDLMRVVDHLIASGTVDTVIAEAVGSCTDLQATVVRPLQEYHGDKFTVAPLTTVVDPLRLRAFDRAVQRGEPESDLSYLFGRQLAESELIAVNKTDLVDADERAALVTTLQERYPGKVILPYSATSGAGLDAVLTAWQAEAAWAQDLVIDYDRYAAAEAQLAWLNQEFRLTAVADGFSPLLWGTSVLEHISQASDEGQAEIGHAKLTIETAEGLTKLSITAAGTEPTVDRAVTVPATGGRAIVNARVACEPELMDQIVLDAVAHADDLSGTRSEATEANSFKPGYPTPVYRLASSDI
ncbi:MAG TPA: GTP-binding protein [Kineosporiaceae bacterium]